MIPTTRPDSDEQGAGASVDLHARKLVGAKALRDLARFERLTSLPLSVRETLGALLGGLLAIALLTAAGMLLLK